MSKNQVGHLNLPTFPDDSDMYVLFCVKPTVSRWSSHQHPKLWLKTCFRCRVFETRREVIWMIPHRSNRRTEAQTQVCLNPKPVLFLCISIRPSGSRRCVSQQFLFSLGLLSRGHRVLRLSFSLREGGRVGNKQFYVEVWMNGLF